MCRWSKAVGLMLLLIFIALNAVAEAMTSEEIVSKSKPSVVRILIEVKPGDSKLFEFYNFNKSRRFSEPIRVMAGTGFVVNENGYIVTAYHVVRPLGKTPTIYVRLPKEGDYLADIVSTDKERQLACLKIKKNGLQPLQLAEALPSVGSEVFTLGYPIAAVTSELTDQEATFTEGKVGALKQSRQEAQFIQTNVAINLGNSGGPLLNKDGQVSGIIIGSTDRSFRKLIKGDLGFKELFQLIYPENVQKLLHEEDIPVGIGFASPAKYGVNMLTNDNVPFLKAGAAAAAPAPPKTASSAPASPPDPPKATDTKSRLLQPIIIGLVGIAAVVLAFAIIFFTRKKSARAAGQQSSVPQPPAPAAKNTSLSFGALKCTSGELDGKTFTLSGNGLKIGRDDDNDICINTETVSRKHCWIGPSGNGIAVRDLGSTNGTYLNGSKIEGTQPVKSGDVISLSKSGQEAFAFAE